jgi:hypothetical protein
VSVRKPGELRAWDQGGDAYADSRAPGAAALPPGLGLGGVSGAALLGEKAVPLGDREVLGDVAVFDEDVMAERHGELRGRIRMAVPRRRSGLEGGSDPGLLLEDRTVYPGIRQPGLGR